MSLVRWGCHSRHLSRNLTDLESGTDRLEEGAPPSRGRGPGQEHLSEEGARAVLERACGVSRAWMVPGQEGQGLLELPCENRRGRLESG